MSKRSVNNTSQEKLSKDSESRFRQFFLHFLKEKKVKQHELYKTKRPSIRIKVQNLDYMMMKMKNL